MICMKFNFFYKQLTLNNIGSKFYVNMKITLSCFLCAGLSYIKETHGYVAFFTGSIWIDMDVYAALEAQSRNPLCIRKLMQKY